MDARPLVVLFRETAGEDPYVAAFEDAGYRAECLPVLKFRFVNQKALASALERPEAYDGLILTSPRAVEAIGRASVDLHPWAAKAAFAVGPETAGRASERGLNVTGAEPGSAAALLAEITAVPLRRPLLFPCGNRRRDEIPGGLRHAGIAFQEVVVYETEAVTPAGFGSMDVVDWVVFFSPSGVEAAAPFSARLERTRIAAIGRTTAEALAARGLPPRAVAEHPEPRALAAAVTEADRK